MKLPNESNAVIKSFSAPPEVMQMLTEIAEKYHVTRSRVIAMLIRREYVRCGALKEKGGVDNGKI